MLWKKVPASSIIPTPGEVGQQISSITGLGRALYCVMEKDSNLCKHVEFSSSSTSLGACGSADTQLAQEFFSLFQDFANNGLYSLLTTVPFMTGVFPPLFASSITGMEVSLIGFWPWRKTCGIGHTSLVSFHPMPVRMHLDPNMHVREDLQWHQCTIACALASITVLLPPILCNLLPPNLCT